MLPQDLDEVEGVEAQQQNQLILTFPVITGSLGRKNWNFHTQQSPNPWVLWDEGEGRSGNEWKAILEAKIIPKIPILPQKPRELGGEHPVEVALEGKQSWRLEKQSQLPVFHKSMEIRREQTPGMRISQEKSPQTPQEITGDSHQAQPNWPKFHLK